MASPLEQNQLNCSICLKLFNDPVSTPCGHNFCKSCLCAFWDISDLCRCPLCMETFYSRPKLDINTSFRELVEHFKTLTVDEELVARSGEVACDICTGKKLKALKSCLVCLTSFCKSHLEPHQRVSTLKIHKLIDPVENLENRMCVKHQRLLELFCRDDQSCVCHLCCETDHKRHLIVSLEAASELERTETETNIKEIQRMMQERQIRIQEMFDSLDNIKKSALEEIDVSTQVFTAMTEFVVKCQNELIEEIKEKMKTKEKRLGEIIANLVQEMTELQKRSNELEQFLQTEDHFNLLQKCVQTQKIPHTNKWLNIPIHQIEFISCARIATCKVQDFINKEKERLSAVEIDQIKRFTGPRGRVLSEEQFSCSICLEIFVEPVSTPCGHSFCKACLQGYWNHSKKFTCPMCKKSYHKKPELSINRVLAEISTQFQGLMADGGGGGGATDGGGLGLSPGSTLTLGGSERVEGGGGHVGSPGLEGGDFARAGEVPCDSCIGRKIKAKKSCLSCPGSYCEVHLKHHKKVKSLASHRLIEPVFHLEEKICKKHQRLLEAYCRHDHACICISCGDTAHKTHEIVSLDREWKKKMSNLGKRKLELKHLIKERAKILEEIKQSIKVIKTSAQKELEDSWQVYAELQRLVEQSQAELVELIATRQREAERQAQEVARGLENELSLLRRRSAELDALAQTQDKVLFLQAFPGLPPPPDPSDWSGVSVNTDLYLGSIRSSVGTLVDRFQEELKRLHGKELRKLQNYSSEVILDSATAQRDLVLSDDGHQVKYEERKATAPAPSEGPHRFSPALFVLGREGLTSGRHYWEVDTARKTAWTLGVARASARRKGEIKLSPDGGFWCLWLKGGEIKALASARVALPLASPPAKVAVFLDYEAGRVSFYDAKARQHLYTFHDMFSESLHPIFSPCLNQEGKNAAPLVLNPVKHG